MEPDHRYEERSAEQVTTRFALGDPSTQGRVRAEIRRLLTSAGCRDELVDDVLIVVSELWSNATEHAGAIEVSTEISVAPAGVVTSVSYRAPGSATDDIPDGRMPPAAAERGRGLAIVDALTESFRHEIDGNSVSTICRFASA